MKLKLISILSLLIIVVSGLFIKQCSSYNKLQQQYSLSQANNKAYQSQLDTATNKSNVFQFKVNQLSYLNDSIISKLKSVQQELKIKDKNLQELQYIASKASRVDTITFNKRDTLFKDKYLNIDTVIGDKWYNLKVGLSYPSTIVVSPTFNSERYVISSYKKDYVNTPSKWWFKRIFQKKQKLIVVDIVEKNPYIVTQQKRFIQIIK